MKQSTVKRTKFGGPRLIVHDTETAEYEAQAAFQLIERFGSVAAVPDGEDSSGRQRLRLQTPEELVERCFTIARLFMAEARRRNLVHILPDIAELLPREDEEDVI